MMAFVALKSVTDAAATNMSAPWRNRCNTARHDAAGRLSAPSRHAMPKENTPVRTDPADWMAAAKATSPPDFTSKNVSGTVTSRPMMDAVANSENRSSPCNNQFSVMTFPSTDSQDRNTTAPSEATCLSRRYTASNTPSESRHMQAFAAMVLQTSSLSASGRSRHSTTARGPLRLKPHSTSTVPYMAMAD